MGIVMAVFMLLGVWLMSPWPVRSRDWLLARPSLVRTLGVGVLGAGMWNALWHGLRHLGTFWGQAALVSGLLMMAIGGLAIARRNRSGAPPDGPASGSHTVIEPVSLQLVIGLLACFLLYFWTLVRLNLGYSIIE